MSGESGDFLSITFVEEDDFKAGVTDCKRTFPFARSPVFKSDIIEGRQLTTGEDVNLVYDIALDVKDVAQMVVEPGDTIGILPCNNLKEIEQIFKRLNLQSLALKCYKLNILENTTKKKAKIPSHIPAEGGTLYDLFARSLDIRNPPKKLFLRSLIRYTSDKDELEKLKLLCSPKASKEYATFLTTHRTLLSVLTEFASCQPPVEKLLEYLPALQARPYSISSSPLLHENELHITFSVMEGDKKGVCSGWLESIMDDKQKDVSLYLRNVNNFRLPDNSSLPIIMIGHGTAIAPFVGFLQHRRALKERYKTELGSSWLFYGCRYAERDFLYKKEIEEFLDEGVLDELITCFSREGELKTYVQDVIKTNGKILIEKLINEEPVIFVCGSNEMTKQVKTAIAFCFTKYGGLTSSEANDFVTKLEEKKRYVEDIWV